MDLPEFIVIFSLFLALAVLEIEAQQSLSCSNRRSPCFIKSIKCPTECPRVKPTDPTATRGCFLDCNSPKCETVCRNRRPNCNSPGAACFDPRFIGGDGIIFYFHGRRNEHFSLISDPNLQINARFIGLRPAQRTRDYTWIQALGIMFGSHTFTIEAKRAAKWENQTDHLQFTYDGEQVLVQKGHLSEWKAPEQDLTIERTSIRNSARVTLVEVAEITVNVVPVTEQDDRVHNYKIPSDDCFAHLEVQFRFFRLSPEVEGVLGRTYQPDFENPAKRGVAMPVVGGEDKYKTSSLVSSDCGSCVFSPADDLARESTVVMDYGAFDCSGKFGSGLGIVCRK